MSDNTNRRHERRSFLAKILAGAGACAFAMFPTSARAKLEGQSRDASEREADYYEPLYRRGRDQAG